MRTIEGIAWRKDEDGYLAVEGYMTLEFAKRFIEPVIRCYMSDPTIRCYMSGPANDIRLYCKSL